MTLLNPIDFITFGAVSLILSIVVSILVINGLFTPFQGILATICLALSTVIYSVYKLRITIK